MEPADERREHAAILDEAGTEILDAAMEPADERREHRQALRTPRLQRERRMEPADERREHQQNNANIAAITPRRNGARR